MKNKNGFTLVELLAVIVIIAIVATIGVFSAITIKDKMNKKMFEATLNEIVTQATTFANDNKEEIDESGLTQTINSQNKKIFQMSVDQLKAVGYYKGDDESLVSYKTGNSIANAQLILYMENSSGRMNACFADDAANSAILGDDETHTEFGSLGVYCSKVSSLGGFTQIAIGLNTNDWMPQKTMTMEFNNVASPIVAYKIVPTKEECGNDYDWKNFGTISNKQKITKVFGNETDDNREYDEDGQKIYICVKDETGAVTRSSKIVKKIDHTVPTCQDVAGDWIRTNGTPTTAKAGCTDTLSGCKQAEFSKQYTIANNASAENLIVTIEDNAGNKKDCVAKMKIDNIPPTCKASNGANNAGTWINTNLTVEEVCEDKESGCASPSFSKTFSTTSKKGTITISDNAGNTTNCEVNVYIDKTKPTCGTVTGMPSSWTNQNVNVAQACTDGDSGCVKSSYAKTVTSNGDTLTISDKAGNNAVCTYGAIKIDKEKPVISKITKTNSNLIENTAGAATIKNEKCPSPTECSAEVHTPPYTSVTTFYSPNLSYVETLSGIKLQNCDFNVYDTSWREVYDKTLYFYYTTRETLLGYAKFTCTLDDNAGNTSSNKAIVTYSIYIN